MSEYSPSSEFHEAAKYLSSASALSNVSNDVKLELYGLFKYLSVSPDPSKSQSRPSFFDFVGRAKWDAWATVGKTYSNGADAEERYKTLAKELGWTPGATAESSNTNTSVAESSDDIWDKEDTNRPKKGGGMGTAVSTLKAPSPNVDKEEGLHVLALVDDGAAVATFLDQYPGVDINAADEYGYTPLHLACDRGNAAVVKVLLARGADRNLKDPDEMTPLELAEVAGHNDVLTLLQ